MVGLKNRRTLPDESPSSSSSPDEKRSTERVIEMQQALYLELSRIDDLIERHNRKQNSSENGKKST